MQKKIADPRLVSNNLIRKSCARVFLSRWYCRSDGVSVSSKVLKTVSVRNIRKVCHTIRRKILEIDVPQLVPQFTTIRLKLRANAVISFFLRATSRASSFFVRSFVHSFIPDPRHLPFASDRERVRKFAIRWILT